MTAVVYRPMTDEEIRMARALGNCSFMPASFDKRFARGMEGAIAAPEPQITEAQAATLRRQVFRYRRQIPKTIVDLVGVPPPAPWTQPSRRQTPSSPPLPLFLEPYTNDRHD